MPLRSLLFNWELFFLESRRDRRGRDRMVGGFTYLPMQSVSITTDVVSSNLDQGEVYIIMW
jgi:hypothetical protein